MVIHWTLAGLLAGAAARRDTDGARPHAVPLVVTSAGVVVDTCPQAAAAGIEIGMTADHARQVCRPLEAVDRAAVAAPLFQARFDEMCRLAYRLSPRVEPDPPLSLYFDLREPGAGGRWPAEQGERLREVLAPLARALVPRAGHRLRVGAAPNRFLARIAGHLLQDRALLRRAGAAAPLIYLPPGDHGPAEVLAVPPGAEARLLAPLPVSLLWPLAPEARERLRELGFYTIGAVAAAGADLLQEALGAHGLQAARLAAGIDPTPVAAAYGPEGWGAATARESRAADLLGGSQMNLWSSRPGAARRPPNSPGAQGGGAGTGAGSPDLPPRLVQGLRRKFPGSAIGLGAEFDTHHREQMLSYWDPLRIQGAGDRAPAEGDD